MMLKIDQVIQKSFRSLLESGSWAQVKRRGTHGRRNRSSWWGKMLRIMIPVMAEVKRGFWSIVFILEPGSGKELGISSRAGPRSCGRLTRVCW